MAQPTINATLLTHAWRKVDIKLTIDGDMHILRWRRRLFSDEVLIDGRQVAQSSGLWGRETVFGLAMRLEREQEVRLLLSIDPNQSTWDWSGDMRPRGIRLETADETLVEFGSLGVDRTVSFSEVYDRALKALGLS